MQNWKEYSGPIWLFLLIASACQSQPTFLTGEVEGLSRDSVYLYKWVLGRWEKAAAAKVENGKFSFRGSVSPGIYLWGISPQEGDLVVINGKDVPHIRGQVAQLFQTYTYEKSPENEELLRLRRHINALYQQASQAPPDQRETFQKAIDSVLRGAEKSTFNAVRVYSWLFRFPTVPPASPNAAETWKAIEKGFWEHVRWTEALLPGIPETFMRMQGFWQNALALMPEDSVWKYGEAWVKSLPSALQAAAWLALLDAGQRFQLTETMVWAGERFIAAAPTDPRRPQIEQFVQAEGALRRGQPAPDIALPDVEGKIRRLSELRGKWVLIDFWASWCRPCRVENPRVVQLYQKYNSRGFEIFGVSLDQNREAWIQAIQADKLTWIHVSDLKGWQSAAAQLYRVSGIPFTVLVDPQGRIAAKGLRGPNLEAKLKELFP
ncbi:MAG: AhpC/TSA family protein [Bacteroidia bacterium]|nr:AhpC/TSA family protein [Bacteroidia bacterium]